MAVQGGGVLEANLLGRVGGGGVRERGRHRQERSLREEENQKLQGSVLGGEPGYIKI